MAEKETTPDLDDKFVADMQQPIENDGITTKTTSDEETPCCQNCGTFGFFALSGICDACELREIEGALNEQN